MPRSPIRPGRRTHPRWPARSGAMSASAMPCAASRARNSGTRRAASSTRTLTRSPMSSRPSTPGAPCQRRVRARGASRRHHREQRARHRLLQPRRRVAMADRAGMQQRQARAALGLVHVGGGEQDGDAAARAGRRGCPRSRGARPGPRRSSARRAAAPAGYGSARRPGRASASCRRKVARRGGGGTAACRRPPAIPGCASRRILRGHREQLGVEKNILGDRQVFIQAEALRHVAEHAAWRAPDRRRHPCLQARCRRHPGAARRPACA